MLRLFSRFSIFERYGKQVHKRTEKYLAIGDHLEELRIRLIACLGILILLTVLMFLISSQLHQLIYQTFATQVDVPLILQDAYGGIQVLLKLSIYSALVIGWPIAFTILWRFITPAIRERRTIWLGQLLVIISAFFFFLGLFFAWKYLLPASNQFLLVLTLPEGVIPQLSVERYYAFVFTMLFVCGTLFQLPILLFLMGITGIMPFAWHGRHWKGITVGIFLVAALLTPPDPISQILLGGLLLGIYALTVGLLWMLGKRVSPKLERKSKRKRKQMKRRETKGLATP